MEALEVALTRITELLSLTWRTIPIAMMRELQTTTFIIFLMTRIKALNVVEYMKYESQRV